MCGFIISMYKQNKIVLGIPVFNEILKISNIVKRLENATFLDEIVFIDDCSKDGSYEYLVNQGRIQSFKTYSKIRCRGCYSNFFFLSFKFANRYCCCYGRQ